MTYVLRLWCELARGLAGHGDKSNTRITLGWLHSRLTNQVDGVLGSSDELATTCRHIVYDVIRGRCEEILLTHPMWSGFDHLTNIQKTSTEQELPGLLLAFERESQYFEDFSRANMETSSEYARSRSRCLAVRGRSLYLRGHFLEGNRLLTLAQSDLGDQSPEDKFLRAVILLYRAELLAHSASDHYQDASDSDACLRKLETAVENLDTAERLLVPSLHRPMWWLRLHIGRAQLRHEEIIVELGRLGAIGGKESGTYAKQSLWLERRALDALRSLRQGLDALPVTDDNWEKQKEEMTQTFVFELKILSLWMQLLIASVAYDHMLISAFQFPPLGGDMWPAGVRVKFRRIDRMLLPLSASSKVQGFWNARWRPWCEMRQFYHFATDPCSLLKDEAIEKAFENFDYGTDDPGGWPLLGNSPRDELLRIEVEVLKNGYVRRLWESRRNRMPT